MSYSLADLRDRARRGWVYQARAAYWLGLAGFDVQLSKYEMRRDDESPDRFRDEEDIRVGIDGWKYEAVEVKSKNVTFSAAPESFPFDDVLAYGTRKGRRDLPVLLFSSATKDAPPLGLIDDGSERFVRMTTDQRRGIEYQVWVAPKRLLLGFDDWCAVLRTRLEVAA